MPAILWRRRDPPRSEGPAHIRTTRLSVRFARRTLRKPPSAGCAVEHAETAGAPRQQQLKAVAIPPVRGIGTLSRAHATERHACDATRASRGEAQQESALRRTSRVSAELAPTIALVTALNPDHLLAPFEGHRVGEVKGLHSFAFMPGTQLDRLAKLALDENWGHDNFVLTKYLAEHVPLSISQNRMSFFNDQLILTAGSLQTRYGTPVYLVFELSTSSAGAPWALRAVTDRPRAVSLPQPPQLPEWPQLEAGSEVVIAHEHILEDNEDRVRFLSQTPRVAQMCAVAGAIQWSIHRGLVIQQLYFGTQSYFVPVYLTSREDITAPPDLVAPVQVQPGYLVARTLLLPHMAYARARVAANRADQLPSWLLRGWAEYAQSVSSQDDIEPDE